MTKKNKHTFRILCLMMFSFALQGCASEYEKAVADYTKQYDCINIDDCLSKYNFEGARAFVNLIDPNNSSYSDIAKYSEGWEKIINQESDFWFNDGNYEKAISIIKDEKLKFHFSGGTMFDQSSYNLALYKLIRSIIEELLFENKIQEAKKWCFRLPDATTEGWTRSGTSEFDAKPKMKETMMMMITEFEEISE